jgi:hypothetical protein
MPRWIACYVLYDFTTYDTYAYAFVSCRQPSYTCTIGDHPCLIHVHDDAAYHAVTVDGAFVVQLLTFSGITIQSHAAHLES